MNLNRKLLALRKFCFLNRLLVVVVLSGYPLREWDWNRDGDKTRDGEKERKRKPEKFVKKERDWGRKIPKRKREQGRKRFFPVNRSLTIQLFLLFVYAQAWRSIFRASWIETVVYFYKFSLFVRAPTEVRWLWLAWQSSYVQVKPFLMTNWLARVSSKIILYHFTMFIDICSYSLVFSEIRSLLIYMS